MTIYNNLPSTNVSSPVYDSPLPSAPQVTLSNSSNLTRTAQSAKCTRVVVIGLSTSEYVSVYYTVSYPRPYCIIYGYWSCSRCIGTLRTTPYVAILRCQLQSVVIEYLITGRAVTSDGGQMDAFRSKKGEISMLKSMCTTTSITTVQLVCATSQQKFMLR